MPVSGEERPLHDGHRLTAEDDPLSGGPTRNFPGLDVTFSVPVLQANGNVVPSGTNLAPLFNIAGSEIDANGRVRVTADWVVGTGLLLPAGEKTVTITAKVTDTLGRTGVTRNSVTKTLRPIPNSSWKGTGEGVFTPDTRERRVEDSPKCRDHSTDRRVRRFGSSRSRRL